MKQKRIFFLIVILLLIIPLANSLPLNIKDVKISSEDIVEKATESGIQIINSIELKQEKSGPVYYVSGTKQARLLFLLPIEVEIDIKLNAKTGKTIYIKRQLWNLLAF